jgi:hypothetical protein
MMRGHARLPQVERAEVTEPFNGGSNLSVISSLVEHFLVPTLLENDIVLLDNVSFDY